MMLSVLGCIDSYHNFEKTAVHGSIPCTHMCKERVRNLTLSATICNFKTNRSKVRKLRITPETPPYPPFPKEQSSSSSSSSSSTSAPIASPALQTSQGVRISLFYKKKFFFSKKISIFSNIMSKNTQLATAFSRLYQRFSLIFLPVPHALNLYSRFPSIISTKSSMQAIKPWRKTVIFAKNTF